MADRLAAVIGEMTAIVIPIAFLVAVAWVIYVIAQERTRREAQRAELQIKLLERVGSAREFGEFLGSPAGERFLQALAPIQPRNRLFTSIRVGTFLVAFALIVLGAAFWRLLGSEADDLQVLAIVVLAIGLATLASAALSHAAARRLGLDTPSENISPPPR
jgi:hypothetical protein